MADQLNQAWMSAIQRHHEVTWPQCKFTVEASGGGPCAVKCPRRSTESTDQKRLAVSILLYLGFMTIIRWVPQTIATASTDAVSADRVQFWNKRLPYCSLLNFTHTHRHTHTHRSLPIRSVRPPETVGLVFVYERLDFLPTPKNTLNNLIQFNPIHLLYLELPNKKGLGLGLTLFPGQNEPLLEIRKPMFDQLSWFSLRATHLQSCCAPYFCWYFGWLPKGIISPVREFHREFRDIVYTLFRE